MKLYEHKETTPLSFYKFFMYVYLPIGMAGGLFSLISFIFLGNLFSYYASWYRVALIVQDVVLLTLYVFLFFGMLKWKKYTFALLIASLALCIVLLAGNIIYFMTNSIVTMSYSSIPNYQPSDQIISLVETMTRTIMVFTGVASVVLYVLMFFYFYKRRLLFNGVPYKIPPKYAQPYPPYPQQPYSPQQPYPPQQYYSPQQPYPPQYYQPPQPNLPRFYQYSDQCCTNCGRPRLSDEYIFCPNCGKEYPNQ